MVPKHRVLFSAISVVENETRFLDIKVESNFTL